MVRVTPDEEKNNNDSNVLRTIFSPLINVGKKIQNLTKTESDSESSSSDDLVEELHHVLKDNDSYSDSEQDDYYEEEFDPYTFIASLPSPEKLPLPTQTNILPKRSSKDKRKTLVLDLDETLVHCSLEKIDNPDVIFKVPFYPEEFEVYGRKRPYFDVFLETLSKNFEIAVFTASQRVLF